MQWGRVFTVKAQFGSSEEARNVLLLLFVRTWYLHDKLFPFRIIDEFNVRFFFQGSSYAGAQSAEGKCVGAKGNQLVIPDHGVSEFNFLNGKAIGQFTRANDLNAVVEYK